MIVFNSQNIFIWTIPLKWYIYHLYIYKKRNQSCGILVLLLQSEFLKHISSKYITDVTIQFGSAIFIVCSEMIQMTLIKHSLFG